MLKIGPRAIRRCMSTTKHIYMGNEARLKMLAGCNQLADAVGVTLGPKGRNVIIEQSYGLPKLTKDGVTVAKAISFDDSMTNLGASLIKQVALSTNERAGDGTTTATILARSIFKQGCEAVAAGLNPMDILRGIQSGLKSIVSFLNIYSKPVNTINDIYNVATISANGDTHIGSLLSAAMEKVGKDGIITIGEGKTLSHELDVVNGLKVDRGYLSPFFVNNTQTQKCELTNHPKILLLDTKVNSIKDALPILEYSVRSRAPLLIIAHEYDSEALATLVINKLRLGIDICAIKAPGFGDHKSILMQDLATVTGATALTNENFVDSLTKLDSVAGTAKSISISNTETIIVEGQGDAKQIEKRANDIRANLNSTTSEYEKEKLQDRLAKLIGGVAMIKVGGSSEVEISEVKDRLNDALCATKAAVEEGILPGGGTALVYASKALADVREDNHDRQTGLNIIRNACLAPCKLIASNAGHEGSVITEKLLREGQFNYGFDAKTGNFVDMVAAGIIDPTKVVKTSITDAVSVASLMTTTEAAIVKNEPTDAETRRSDID